MGEVRQLFNGPRTNSQRPFADSFVTGTPMHIDTSWHHAIHAFLDYLRAGGAPPTTIGQRRYHLGRLADGVGGTPASLEFETLVAWLVAHHWAPNTLRSYRGSFRAFYTWARATGIVTTSVAHQLPPVKIPRAKPRPTPELALHAALAAADPRSALAMKLACWCGLRRGELARVAREDVEVDLYGHQLRVVGKGGHVRLVPLPDELATELLARPAGWAFPSPRGGHLTPHHLAKTIAEHFPDGLTTHNLRHRCGTTAYQGTRDLRAVQELLGHAKPETTALYTEVAQDTVRAAMLAAVAA